jgi:hypothetical protein
MSVMGMSAPRKSRRSWRKPRFPAPDDANPVEAHLDDVHDRRGAVRHLPPLQLRSFAQGSVKIAARCRWGDCLGWLG